MKRLFLLVQKSLYSSGEPDALYPIVAFAGVKVVGV